MMTEREKMLAGLGYCHRDEELVALHRRAQKLFRAYNKLDPEQGEEREHILRELFGSCGINPFVESDFRCDYGFNIHAGDNFFANYNCVMLDVNEIRIGNNVMFAPYVQLYTAYHPLDVATRISGIEYGAPIMIGDNVWIGGGAIVLPGVTIGNNAISGAGSVVTRDIPADTVAAGNPARVLKTLEIAK